MLDSSPPTSDVFSDEMDSVSIRNKSLLNRSVPKHNNNNFKAGYLPVDNSKSAPRGRKTFAFWTLVALLFILAIGNLILTLTILAVLKLGQGMESIELIPDAGAIKLLGKIDLDHIYKRDGRIEGFEKEPVVVTAEDSSIILNLYSRAGRAAATKLTIDKNETVFRGITSFDIKNERDESMFTITGPKYTSLKNGRNIKANRIQTNKIRSPSGDNLKIEAERVNLKGAEGTKMEGKKIIWTAEEDILYSSSNGSIILNGREGTFIDITRVPTVKLSNNNYVMSQFKVCVCVPGGKLFKIPVVNPNDRTYCHHVNMQHNFCI